MTTLSKELIDAFHREVARHPDEIALAASAAELRRLRRRGLVAAFLGIEGGHALYVGDHPVDGHAAARAGVRFVRVLTGEDFGEGPWAGIEPLVTVKDVGALPAVLG